jgi:hypothetical protein
MMSAKAMIPRMMKTVQSMRSGFPPVSIAKPNPR